MPHLYEEIPRPEYDRYFYMFSHFAVRALGLATVLFRTEGTENIPETGAAIIASNHLHWTDTIFVPSAVPDRHVTVLGREGVMIPIFEHWGALSFHRPEEGETMSMETTRQLLTVLEQGRLLQMYAPGTRQPGQRPSNVKRGAAFFSKMSGAPIVPTIIKGADRLSEQRVTVRFAPPITDIASNKSEEMEISNKLAGIIRDNYDDIDLSVFRRY